MKTAPATTATTKPDPFLDSATILVDSREQTPFDFGPRVRSETVALPSGDYGLRGHSIAIERKSLPDLRHCVGGDRARFEKELQRLSKLDFAAVVVEADWSELRKPGRCWQPGTRTLSPNAVLGSLTAWSVKYRLPVWLVGNWVQGREVTYRLLRHHWRYASPDSPDYRGKGEQC